MSLVIVCNIVLHSLLRIQARMLGISNFRSRRRVLGMVTSGATVGRPWAHENGICVRRNAAMIHAASCFSSLSPNMIAPRHALLASKRCIARGG